MVNVGILRPIDLLGMVLIMVITASLWKCRDRCCWSRDRVSPRGLTEEGSAQFGRSLLGLEVDVHDAEPIAEASVPLKIIHRAPLEVALHRDAVGARPLKLRQIIA